MNRQKSSSRTMRSFVSLAVFAVIALLTLPAMAEVPVSITQQGRIMDDGEPMTGTEALEFELYDEESGGAVLWSDTISADLGDDGVYTVTLGDDDNPIDATILQDGEVYLQLTAAGEEFPDRFELTSVPFATIADVAQSVVDGGVTSSALADGAVTSDAVSDVSWDQITGVPSEVGETYDALDALGCSSGQFPLYNGSWGCETYDPGQTYSGDDFAISGEACGSGEVMVGVDTSGYPECVTEQDTTYSAGTGLDLSGEEFSLDGDAVVECEGSTCPVGDSSKIYFDGDTDGDYWKGVESFTFCNPLTGTCTTADWMAVGTDFSVEGGVDIEDEIAVNTDGEQADYAIYAETHEDSFRQGIGLKSSGDDEHGWGIGVGNNTERLFFSHADNVADPDTLSSTARIEEDGEYTQTSDGRLKRDVKALQGVLDDVLQLEPSQYYHENSADSDPTVGFIAQQVEEIFPELVDYDEDMEFYGLSYANFSVLAIQAIQEQQEIIDRQEQRLDDLEARIQQLENE